MRRAIAAIAAIALAVTVFGAVSANDDDDDNRRGSFKGNLNGYQEVPAISTTGTGALTLKVNSAGTQIGYTLRFANLKGGVAGAAHIHFAQADANGGVLAFLCGGGSKPACPAAGGTVTGNITAADIQAIPAQGIAGGDLAAVLRAIRAGATYVNVHTAGFPNGEIRGQIKGR